MPNILAGAFGRASAESSRAAVRDLSRHSRKLVICRLERPSQVLNEIGADAVETGIGDILGAGSRISQPNRPSHHRGALERVRQLPELIAVLSNHGRLDLVNELPRVSGKFRGQSLYETRISGER